MPIYEYACRSCGRRVEVIHGINDAGPAACEVCGGAMAKLLSPPAIVFKGSGWAKKDARAATTTKQDGGEKRDGDEKPSAPGGDTAAGSGDGKRSPSGERAAPAKDAGRGAPSAPEKPSGGTPGPSAAPRSTPSRDAG